MDTAKSRPAVTQAKRRRTGELLKRASQQRTLLKQDSLAPGKANLSSKKAQYRSCADIAKREIVQAGFSACVMPDCLTLVQTYRDKGPSAYPTSKRPLTPLGKTWASSHLVAKQPHLSLSCEVPAKEKTRKEPPLLVAHTFTKVVDLNCELPDSFEMEEVRWIFVCSASIPYSWYKFALSFSRQKLE